MVVLSCFVCQLGLGYTYLFSAVLPEATAELGWTRAEFSSGRIPYFLMTGLGGLAAGQWTVRYGARRVLIAGALSLAAALALLSRMQDLATYWAAQTLYGLFMAGLGDVAIAGVLTAWVQRGRGAAMGFVYAASNLAGALIPSLFAYGVEARGWRATLLAMGLAGGAAILPFAWIAGRRAPVAPAATAAPASSTQAAAGGRALALSDAMRTRSFWLLAFGLFCFFVFFLGMNDAFVAFMGDLGMSRTEANAVYGLATGVGGLSKLAAGVFADRLHPKLTLLADHALLLLSALLLLALPQHAPLSAFLVCYGFGIAARDVVYPLAISFCFGERTMPAVYGALMMALVIAAPLGSWISSTVRDTTGSYTPAFTGFALMNAAVLASLPLVRRELDAPAQSAPAALGERA
ncbi:MAG TPA: MFS transporter [Myxococcota bacterium]|nr:MFS transporter [Myxococcota bacterium]